MSRSKLMGLKNDDNMHMLCDPIVFSDNAMETTASEWWKTAEKVDSVVGD